MQNQWSKMTSDLNIPQSQLCGTIYEVNMVISQSGLVLQQLNDYEGHSSEQQSNPVQFQSNSRKYTLIPKIANQRNN